MDDMERILELGTAFTLAYGNGMEPCEDSMRAITEGLITQDDGAMFVTTECGDVAGFIGLASFNSHINQSYKMAQELFFWIDPEYRGGKHARLLLDAAEQWSVEIGCDKLLMMSVADLRGKLVGRLYTRRGFTQSEYVYYKELK